MDLRRKKTQITYIVLNYEIIIMRTEGIIPFSGTVHVCSSLDLRVRHWWNIWFIVPRACEYYYCLSLSLSVALCSTCIFFLFIERPWLFDNFDSWLKRVQGKPHKCAAIFVDNSGADIILGIFPFARDLLSRGTKVIRNITFFYWNHLLLLYLKLIYFRWYYVLTADQP